MPNDDKLLKLYNNLLDTNNGVTNYLTMPDYDVFKTSFHDPVKRQKLYNNLKSIEPNVNLTFPDYDEFELIGLGNSVEKSNGNGKETKWYEDVFNFTKTALETVLNPTSLESSKRISHHVFGGLVGAEMSVTESPNYIETGLLEAHKRELKDPVGGVSTGIGFIELPKLTEKQKIEKEITDDITLEKIDNRLHKNYAQMFNRKKEIEQRYIDAGLMDPNKVDSFWTNQAFSLGLNLPWMVASGLTTKVPMISGLSRGLSFIAFTGAEANSLAGDIYGATAEKDKNGKAIAGTGDLDKARYGLAMGTIAGFFEFVGPHMALKSFRDIGLKNLGMKDITGSILKVGAVEGTEEVYQNSIEQWTKLGTGVYNKFDYDELLQSFVGGVVGGVMLGGAGITINATEMASFKNFAENEVPLIAKQMRENKLVPEAEVVRLEKAAEIVKDTDNLPEAINKTNQVLREVAKQEKDNLKQVQAIVDEIKGAVSTIKEKSSRIDDMVWRDNDESIGAVLQRGFNSVELKDQFVDAVQSSEEFKNELNKGIVKSTAETTVNDEIWKTLVQMSNNQQISSELRLRYEDLYNDAIIGEARNEEYALDKKRLEETLTVGQVLSNKDTQDDIINFAKKENKVPKQVKQFKLSETVELIDYANSSQTSGEGTNVPPVQSLRELKASREGIAEQKLSESKTLGDFLKLYFGNKYDDSELEKTWLKLSYGEKDFIRKAAGFKSLAKGTNLDDLIWEINDDQRSRDIFYYIKNNGKRSEEINKRILQSEEYKKLKEFVEKNKQYAETYLKNPQEFRKEIDKLRDEQNYLQQKQNDKQYNIGKEIDEEIGYVEEGFEYKLIQSQIQEQKPLIPKLKGKMTFTYGNQKRSDVTALTTLEAIKKDERTATTRYESEGHIDYWKKAQVGDIIEVEGKTGEKVLVRVTKELHKLEGSGKSPEVWSKLEGWSTDYFEKNVRPKLSQAWQFEYELVKQEKVQEQKELTVAELRTILRENNAIDPDTQVFNEWVLNYVYGDFKLDTMPVKILPEGELIAVDKQGKAGYMTAGTKGAYYNKVVYLNENNKLDKETYNYLSHEVLHPIMAAALNQTSKSFNVEFYKTVKGLYDEAKIRFQTDQKDYYLANKADIDNAMENMQEFADYMLVPTSNFHLWAKRTALTNNQKLTFLQRFIEAVKALFSKLYGNKVDFVTFYEGMSTAFNKHLQAPSPMNYYDFVYGEVNQFGLQEGKTVHEQYFNLNDDVGNMRAVQSVGRLLMKMNNVTNMDPLDYIHTLSLKQFKEMLTPRANVSGSEQYEKQIAILYDKLGTDMPFYTFMEHIQTQQYNQAMNQRRISTIILNMTGDVSKIEEMADTYLGRNNMRFTTWQTDMPIFDYIPVLNQMFGTEFEVINIDGVRTVNGIQGINDYDAEDKPRNRKYTQELLNHGYYFLGTWTDKGTAIALKAKQPLNQESVNEMVKLYRKRIEEFAVAYPEEQIKTDLLSPKEYIGNDNDYTDFLIPKLLRIITEDINRGGMYIEGVYQPMLWTPGVPESGDAKKILKYNVQIAKKLRITEDEELVNRIINEVQKNEKQLTEGGYGIFINKDGHIAFNEVVFDDKDIKPGEYFLEFDFHGIPVKADAYDCLVNTFNTPGTDGIEYYLRNGWGYAYEELNGVIKEGSKKAWGGFNIGEDPIYKKSSSQVISEDSFLGQWMLKNNIAKLTSSTASKIKGRGHKASSIAQIANGDMSNMFQTEFRTINRQGEKNVLNEDAKGLVQSLNTNQTFSGNKYDDNQVKMLNATADIIRKLASKFTNDITNLDMSEIMRMLKSKALSGVSEHERVQAQTILNLAYHLADEKVTQLESNIFMTDETRKGLRKKLRLNQLFADEKIANELGNLFMDPYFSHPIKSYVRERLEDMYGMRTSLEWGTLRPDIGWLDPTMLEEVWKQIKDETDETKREKFQEMIDVKSGRLKSGYTYFADSHKKLGLKIGDKVVLTIVPSTSMVSQYAVKIAAFIPKTSSEPDSITGNSEDIQSYGGRDFDIDTMSIFYQNDDMVSKEAYNDFWEVVKARWDNHKKYLLSDYRQILNKPNLQEKDLFTEDVKVAIARLASRSERTAAKVQNPFTKLFDINDKYQKYVGRIVPAKKITTILGEINARTKIGTWKLNVRHNQVSNNYVVYDVFTHHAVDIPSDTGGMMYYLSNERIQDMRYGLGRKFDGIHDNLIDAQQKDNTNRVYQLRALSRAISIAEDFLIGSAAKINSPYNQDNFGEQKGLAEDYTYISRQQRVIGLLESGNKEALLDMFNQWFNNKYDEKLRYGARFWNGVRNMAIQYISNFEFDKLTDSVNLNLIRAIPLDIVPQTLVSQTVYTKWENDVQQYFQEKYGYADKVKQVFETRSEIKKYKSIANKWLMAAFLSTENEFPIHDIKASLISIMLPVDQTQRDITKIDYDYNPNSQRYLYDNIFKYVASKTFGPLFNLALRNRTMIFNGKANEAVLKTEAGNQLTLKRGKNDQLQIEALDLSNGQLGQWNSGMEFLQSNAQMAIRVKAAFGLSSNNDTTHLLPENADSPVALIGEGNKPTIEQMRLASDNRYRINQMFSFGPNIPLNDRINLAEEFLRKVLPNLSTAEKYELFVSLLGHPDPHETLLTPLNLIANTRESKNEYQYPTQSTLLELLGRLGEYEFVEEYGKVKSQLYPDGLGFKARMDIVNDIENSDDLNSGGEIWYARQSDIAAEVNNEKNDWISNFETIYNIIRSVPRKTIHKNFLFPNILTGQVKLMDDKYVYQTAVAPFNTEFTGTINLEAVQLSKIKYLSEHLNIVSGWFDLIHTAYKNNIQNIYETLDKQVSKQEIWKDINTRLDKGIYGNIQVGRKEASWIFYFNNVEYTDLDKLAEDYSITDTIEKEKFKAVMELRKVYDFTDIMLTKNISSYLNNVLSSLPTDFQNLPIITALYNKWSNLAERMQTRIGKYFPRMFTSEGSDKILHRHAAYELLRELHPKTKRIDLVERARNWQNENEEFKKQVEERFTTFSVNKLEGKVYSWMKSRSVPDEFIDEGDYVIDNDAMHGRHQQQLISAIRDDITKVEWLQYEFEAHMAGVSDKTINRMHKWFANNTMDRYMHSQKIGYDKAKVNDGIGFYYTNANGTEVYYRGIISSINNKEVSLEIDKNIFEKKVKADLEFYAEQHDQIISNPFIDQSSKATDSQIMTLNRLLGETYINSYNPDITILEANDLIYQGLKSMLEDKDNWGKFKRNKIYIKQYGKNKSVKTNGFERAIYNGAILNRIDDLNLLSSVAFLGSPGSGFGNATDALYRIVQSIGWARYFKLWMLNTQSARKANKKFAEARNTGSFEVYNQTLRPYIRKEKELNKETIDKQLEVAFATAAQYILEHGYAKQSIMAGTEYQGLEGNEGLKVVKDATSKYGLWFFGTAEATVRRHSAFMFAAKAVLVDKITDPKKIYEVIEKGVMRANSEYSPWARKLGDSGPLGNLLFKFSQFNTDQFSNFLMQIEVGKQQGQIKEVLPKLTQGELLEAARAMGFNIQTALKRKAIVQSDITLTSEEQEVLQQTTIRASSETDPIILRRIMREAIQDTILASLFMPIKGFRTGNPVTKVGIMASVFLLNLIFSGEGPDDWDTKDWLFGILSIFTGMGIQIPLQLLYQLATDADEISIGNPRVGTGLIDAYNAITTDDLLDSKKAVKNSWYQYGKLSKTVLRMDLTPHYRSYYNESLNKLTSRGILGLTDQAFDLETYLPIYNLMEFYQK